MIAVLLSTYNGERYLREQIDSILSQQDVEIRLFVRDDGSSDGTIDILNSYQHNGQLTWYNGSNLGPAHSFHQLLLDAPNADYYALADQDDVWLEDKLATAVKALGSTTLHSLYISQTQLVDQQLQTIPTPTLHPLLTFGESLVYSFATGCTMVFTNAMRSILIQYPLPSFVLHDQWYYVTATAHEANIIFDSQSHILYRQHAHNVEGLSKSHITLWKERFNRIITHQHIRSRLAKHILATMGDSISDSNKQLVQLFNSATTSFHQRLRLLSMDDFKCGNQHTRNMFVLSLIFNTY